LCGSTKGINWWKGNILLAAKFEGILEYSWTFINEVSIDIFESN
jgi:hypothetical protein